MHARELGRRPVKSDSGSEAISFIIMSRKREEVRFRGENRGPRRLPRAARAPSAARMLAAARGRARCAPRGDLRHAPRPMGGGASAHRVCSSPPSAPAAAGLRCRTAHSEEGGRSASSSVSSGAAVGGAGTARGGERWRPSKDPPPGAAAEGAAGGRIKPGRTDRVQGVTGGVGETRSGLVGARRGGGELVPPRTEPNFGPLPPRLRPPPAARMRAGPRRGSRSSTRVHSQLRPRSLGRETAPGKSPIPPQVSRL